MEYAEIVKYTVIAACSIVLTASQMFLSTRKKIIFGFILPIINFILSAVFVIIKYSISDYESTAKFIIDVMTHFFIMNIPTVIFISVLFIARILHKKYLSFSQSSND